MQARWIIKYESCHISLEKKGYFMEKQNILLVNDFPGYGKVAISAMMPVLSYMGFHLYHLPTALVSNTLDYGKFEILETTDYMQKTMKVWEELGFSFDAVCTGFLVSKKQMELVREFCLSKKETGSQIFVDPIMGDSGKLYHGVSKETVDYMRKLCAAADVLMPNFTEATFLAELYEGKTNLDKMEAFRLLEELQKIGKGSIVISSAFVEEKASILGFDAKQGQSFLVPFEEIPQHFFGTGDLFSAFLTAFIRKGISLEQSCKISVEIIYKLLQRHKIETKEYKGIPLEQYFDFIGEELKKQGVL